MISYWLKREQPPWQSELYAYIIRSRFPGTIALAVAVMLTIDLSGLWPLMFAYLIAVGFINLRNYGKAVEKHIPSEIMGIADMMGPALAVFWLPSLFFPALLMGVTSTVLTRLVYGPRVTMIGVSIVMVLASWQAVMFEIPFGAATLLVYFVTCIRIVSGLDVLARRELAIAETMRERAEHDSLTGLTNRRAFFEHLESRLHDCAEENMRGIRLLYIDVDKFKEVNDSLGHHVGDQFLIELSERLQMAIPKGLVARLGGDEFAVLIDNPDSDCAAIAERVHIALEVPISVDGIEVTASVSIGVARAPQHGTTAVELVNSADAAMYDAKVEQGGSHEFGRQSDFSPSSRLANSRSVRHALPRSQLDISYEPSECFATSSVDRYEVVTQWNHPELGLLDYGAFYELAHESGVACEIEWWSLSTALHQYRFLNDEKSETGLSIGISVELVSRTEFADELACLLADTDVPAERLTIRVSGLSIACMPSSTTHWIGQLFDLGIRVSLEDLSLSAWCLEILRSPFVSEWEFDSTSLNAHTSKSGEALFDALIQNAAECGVEVAARGVSSDAQARWLEAHGCHRGRGDLYSLRAAPMSGIRPIANI